MKKRYFVLILLNLLFCSVVYGQSLHIINTKDLVSVSKRVGLDSVLRIIRNIPVEALDSVSYYNLVKEVSGSSSSRRVSRFFTQYIMKYHNEIFEDDVYEYFKNDVKLIKGFKPRRYGYLPEIPDINLLAMVKYSNNRTEGLLIEYYKEWNKKSKEYINDYKKGEKEILGMKDMLQEPFEDCNKNCLKVLKALDLIKSTFFDSVKYKSHAKYLSKYAKRDLHLYLERDDNGSRLRNPVDTIIISGSFKTIADVDLNNSPKFKKLIRGYCSSYSWWWLVYNGKIAYLDVGYQSGPECGAGDLYWLELVDNMVIVHQVYEWIS